MGFNEITEMIDFRWRVASGNQTHPFTPDALQSIYYHSDGVPREACVIADNSLLLTFLQKKTAIEKETVEIAAKDRKDNIGSARKAEPPAKKPSVKKNAVKSPAIKPEHEMKEVTANG
jgi:hypothetical protein